MKTGVITGVVLGLAIVAWTFTMGFTRFYADPVLQALFWLVVPMEIAAIVWALSRTRTERRYVGQVAVGGVAALIAAVFAFSGSLVFTTIAFPSYFADQRSMQEQMLREAGKSDAEITTFIDAGAAMQTPLFNAMAGAVGTIVTGLVVSALAAIVLRKLH